MNVQKLSRYDLVAVVAQGKLGPVWEGYDPDIRRKVTIKVAPVEHLSEQAADALVARFRAEARVAGKLVHPNIVGVYDAGVESGLAYIVAETVGGATLDAMLRQPGGVPQELVGRIVLQVLAALDHAHSKGVAHLGLQPAQVLVMPSGSVKVADFGAVAAAEPDDSTRAQGSLSENIRCLAPEQVRGLEADARADLWATGVMLYRLWTGHWPFNADSDFGLIQQVIKHTAEAPSARVPPRVPPLGAEHDQLIVRALAKSAAERYPTAREFAADLSRIVAREAASGTLTGTATGRDAVLNAIMAGEAARQAAAPPAAQLFAPAPAPAPAPSEAIPAHGDGAPVDELTDWKRIQTSDAPADFEAFLARYPAGACADLARRRLRRLAGGDDSALQPPLAGALQPPSAAALRPAAPAAVASPAVMPDDADEVTRVIRRPPAANLPPPTPPAKPAPEPTPQNAASRRGGWIAALAAVLVVGFGAVWMLQRGPSTDNMPAAASAVAAAANAASEPGDAAPASAPTVASDSAQPAPSAPTPATGASVPAVAAVPTVAANQTPPGASTTAAKPVNAREAAARKAAADAAVRAAKATAAAPATVTPVDADRSRPAPAPVVEAQKPAEPVVVAAPAAAAEPCGKRVLLARIACMKEACPKAEWAQHPQCIEFRRMEDANRRLSDQQN